GRPPRPPRVGAPAPPLGHGRRHTRRDRPLGRLETVEKILTKQMCNRPHVAAATYDGAVDLGNPRFARPGYCSTSLSTCATSSARKSSSGSCSRSRASARRITSAAVRETPSSWACAAIRRIHGGGSGGREGGPLGW